MAATQPSELVLDQVGPAGAGPGWDEVGTRWGFRRRQILAHACSMAATEPSELVLDQVGPAGAELS